MDLLTRVLSDGATYPHKKSGTHAGEARDFWCRTIGEYTHGNYTEDEVQDPYWGIVTRQLFQSNN